MFCFQCEQTAKGAGCTRMGVCGKNPTTADLQDLLVHAVKGIAAYAHRARKLDAKDRQVDVFVVEALFSTMTNVNFDPARLQELLGKAAAIKAKAQQLYVGACNKAGHQPELLDGPAQWEPTGAIEGLLQQAAEVSIQKRRAKLDPDVASLQELLTYGLKGAAAYADHAQILSQASDEVFAVFHELLAYLAQPNQTVDELLGRCLKAGELNLQAMELLDKANTSAYGHPVPTAVRVEPVQGKAILVSGHDLKDLEALLKQTDGKGINVYTHGEMLPAHGYPRLRAYKHLAGNYGGAWQDQAREFRDFPGAILMTTNCLQQPLEAYKHRIFTSGLVAWPGVRHIADGNFAPVMRAAVNEEGFKEDGPHHTITVGFGHAAVMGVAGKVIEAVKSGAIRRFFLIGGCDGAKGGRNYYTELAKSLPPDCVILTLACGKYRFNKLDFGTVAGLPRLLDIGQCNDAYSAIQIAVALAKAFNCGVNDLPLSFILSWYEQKAVAILLTLLHLGIKNMRLGPSLPAFVSPNVLKVLVEKFSIQPIKTAQEDMKAILG
ncbi:MAG: hydroxylamine reductase [Planctomycetota bacterium]